MRFRHLHSCLEITRSSLLWVDQRFTYDQAASFFYHLNLVLSTKTVITYNQESSDINLTAPGSLGMSSLISLSPYLLKNSSPHRPNPSYGLPVWFMILVIIPSECITYWNDYIKNTLSVGTNCSVQLLSPPY